MKIREPDERAIPQSPSTSPSPGTHVRPDGGYLAIVIDSVLVATLTLLLLVTHGARKRLPRIASPAWTSSIDATVADHG